MGAKQALLDGVVAHFEGANGDEDIERVRVDGFKTVGSVESVVIQYIVGKEIGAEHRSVPCEK